MVEKSLEWGEELWIATLDVEKAFDRVHHSALFDVLVQNHVDMPTVSALRHLYFWSQRLRTRVAGADIRQFDMNRGVKQGDPLPQILFNLVLHGVLQKVNEVWKERSYGSNVGHELRGHRLTQIALADDQTLIARSWVGMKRMILILWSALSERGRFLHPT